jgi:hypothetical protein
VNVALLVLLVPRSGADLGLAGAGIALCGAYLAMLGVMYALTRKLFAVGFEWGRLLHLAMLLAAVAVAGELLLPTTGPGGLLARAAWLGLAPLGLLLTRFFHPHELAQARRLLALARERATSAPGRRGRAEAYAEDPLRDL